MVGPSIDIRQAGGTRWPRITEIAAGNFCYSRCIIDRSFTIKLTKKSPKYGDPFVDLITSRNRLTLGESFLWVFPAGQSFFLEPGNSAGVRFDMPALGLAVIFSGFHPDGEMFSVNCFSDPKLSIWVRIQAGWMAS